MNIYNFFKGNPKNLPQNHPMLAFHHPPPLLNSKLQEGTAQVPLHELGADHRQTPILRTHPKKNTLLVNEKCASKFPKKTKKNSQIPYHPTKKKICIYIYTSNKLTPTFSKKKSLSKAVFICFFKKNFQVSRLSARNEGQRSYTSTLENPKALQRDPVVFKSTRSKCDGVGAYVCDYM